MTPVELGDALADAAARAVREGALPMAARTGPPPGTRFRPTEQRSPGSISDWVTPVALRWAPALGVQPRDVARELARSLGLDPRVEAVEVAPSGLLLITLTALARGAVVDAVLAAPDAWALGPGWREPPTEPAGARPPDDPVRQAQVAHARLCRLVRNAEALGVQVRGSRGREDLVEVSERRLLVALADLPQRAAAPGDAVTDLAGLADDWRAPVHPQVVGAPVERVHGARLGLATAARVVLRNGLWRLGASAPERM
ncbi:MAG: DALR anticodon-binding domain-containing protein [Terracoccus sp.]